VRWERLGSLILVTRNQLEILAGDGGRVGEQADTRKCPFAALFLT
jgi:hypothetical protein